MFFQYLKPEKQIRLHNEKEDFMRIFKWLVRENKDPFGQMGLTIVAS